MISICLACVVYTLKGTHPKDNLYINIFYQWLTMVIKNGGLQSNDMLHIHMDSETIQYLDTHPTVFHEIIQKLQCNFEIHKFDQPDTPLKGMMNKYVFTEYIQDVYIYCDIDIIIRKPFRLVVDNMKEYTMYFCQEHSLISENYSEGFPSDYPVSRNLPGFSAGKFAIFGKGLRDSFFSRIHEICDYSTKYATVEQPLFNRAIYEIPKDIVSVDINMLTEYVSFNGDNFSDEKTIFHDLAGETSNGISHFKKMSDHMCKYYLN